MGHDEANNQSNFRELLSILSAVVDVFIAEIKDEDSKVQIAAVMVD